MLKRPTDINLADVTRGKFLEGRYLSVSQVAIPEWVGVGSGTPYRIRGVRPGRDGRVEVSLDQYCKAASGSIMTRGWRKVTFVVNQSSRLDFFDRWRPMLHGVLRRIGKDSVWLDLPDGKGGMNLREIPDEGGLVHWATSVVDRMLGPCRDPKLEAIRSAKGKAAAVYQYINQVGPVDVADTVAADFDPRMLSGEKRNSPLVATYGGVFGRLHNFLMKGKLLLVTTFDELQLALPDDLPEDEREAVMKEATWRVRTVGSGYTDQSGNAIVGVHEFQLKSVATGEQDEPEEQEDQDE